MLADKGYDADAIVEHVEAMGARAVIPPRRNRKVQREYDKELYQLCHPWDLLAQTFPRGHTIVKQKSPLRSALFCS